MNYIKILCLSAVITGLGSIVSCDRTGYWRKFYYPKCAS